MTIAEDFVPGDDQELEGPEYPEAFGIKFTPAVTFVLCTLIGVAGAGYIIWQMVLPALGEVGELETKRQELEMTLNQKQVGDAKAKIAELQAGIQTQKERQPKVLEMLSSESTVDTLLIDFNKIFQEEGVILETYSPSDRTPQIVNDSSYGDGVNGKLKRMVISIAFNGSIAQTQSIIQRLERFQTLVVIKNFNAQVSQTPTFVFDPADNQIKIKTTKGEEDEEEPIREPILSVSFTAEVLYPMSEAEKAQIEAEAQENAEP